MKIDLVITEMEVGGAERCCYELARFLQHRSHAVRIISIGPFASQPKDGLLRLVREEQIPIFSLNASRTSQFPMAWYRLRRLVRQSKPDIAQSFLWHANVLSASIYPSMRIPLVGGNRVLEPRASRHRFSRWAATRMKKLVCVSQAVAKWSHDVEHVSDEKLVVIPNGIHLANWDSQSTNPVGEQSTRSTIPADAPILLFVGRLAPQKGIDILILSLIHI